MSLTGDTFDFQQGNVVTSSAQIVDNGATVGDVLTVQADKSIAAAPGGGSLPEEWTFGEDGSLTVSDGAEFPADYFILTAATDETFTKYLIVNNRLTIDDAEMLATSDNGPTVFEIDPAGDGGNGTVEVQGVDVATKLAQVTALVTAITATAAETRIAATTDGLGFFGADAVSQPAVSPVPDPSNTTLEAVAGFLNDLIAALGDTSGLGLIADAP